MPEAIPDDPMVQILAELRSLNRTLRMLASHLMDLGEAPPRPAGQGMITPISDALPKGLAAPIAKRLRDMDPQRREHLLGELKRAWNEA
jgi:hypothetical protein